MSESDTTYNGWKNYPTWAVNLWLSNDEGLYRIMTEAADLSVLSGEQSGFYRFVKDFVTNDLAPDLGATFAADLLGYALDLVDWNEIAAAWLVDMEVEA